MPLCEHGRLYPHRVYYQIDKEPEVCPGGCDHKWETVYYGNGECGDHRLRCVFCREWNPPFAAVEVTS